MEWSDRYCLGVEHIDRQHKGLFTAVNRISNILAHYDKDEERNRRACMEAVKYLKNYVMEHFADEEAYQQQIGYPEYKQHRKQHDAFILTVLKREQAMMSQDFSRESVQDFLDMLTAWLLHHIMDADQKIVK